MERIQLLRLPSADVCGQSSGLRGGALSYTLGAALGESQAGHVDARC